MYMSVPAPMGAGKTRKEAELQQQEVEVSNALKTLEGKLSNEEYNKLWQELRHTGKDFDQLYENCKSSTFQFKDHYDDIKKSERLNEALRFHYHQALSTKKRFEEERDAYFQNDKNLASLKDEFIEETQALALSNSRYVEYNQRFAAQRERYIVRMLQDINAVNEKNQKLKADRQRISKELSECRLSLHDAKAMSERLGKENEKLESTCKGLEKVRENLKKEAEWMTRQNNKLKDLNSRLNSDLSATNTSLKAVTEERDERDKQILELKAAKTQLSIRCSQQEQMVESLRVQITRIKEELRSRREEWVKEKSGMKEDVDEMKKKLDRARANTHKTIIRNQQLHEKLKSANHSSEQATAGKLRAVLREQRTQKTNVELTSKQLELISEVLELKSDFFRDQKRVRNAAKLNRRLEATVDVLKDRMQILRKDPTAVIPMEDAQEYREMTRHRFMKDRIGAYSASSARGPTTCSIARTTL